MSSLPSLADAILVFILLVPGFIAFWLTRVIGKFSRLDLSDFEQVIWSFIFSAIILFLFTLTSDFRSIDDFRDRFFYPENFAKLFGFTGLVGLLLGFGIFRLFKRNFQTADPWETTMIHYSRVGSWVKVITKTGHEYTGKYRLAGLKRGSRDLLISAPKQIIRKDDGTVLTKLQIGEELLFTADDIARIFFFQKWDYWDDDKKNNTA